VTKDREAQYEPEQYDDPDSPQDYDDPDADDDSDTICNDVIRDLLGTDGHVGELWDRRRDGAGWLEYEPSKRPVKKVREVCALCAWPIPLKRPWADCEFKYQPGQWWRADHFEFCKCNGCLCPPVGSMGRPKYCGDDCKHRMKLAWERGNRRAAGAKVRSFDTDADRLVTYRKGIRELGQRDNHYPRW
jgi:hypothetical protein